MYNQFCVRNKHSHCCTAVISCCTRPGKLSSPSSSQRICPQFDPTCSSRSGRTRTVWPGWSRPARPAAASRRRPSDCYRAPCQPHHHPRQNRRRTWSQAHTRRSAMRRTRGRTWACWSRIGASPPACESRPPAGSPGPRTRVYPEPSRYRRCTPYRPCVRAGHCPPANHVIVSSSGRRRCRLANIIIYLSFIIVIIIIIMWRYFSWDCAKKTRR